MQMKVLLSELDWNLAKTNLEMPSSLYIHIPFCETKCHYCAFNTYSFHKEQAKVYIDALQTEMALYAPETSILKTIYVGGGTPSILDANELNKLFTNIHKHFQICPDVEITVECNPGTVDSEKLRVMQDAGVNRLSFGLQAMQEDMLRQLGRIHTVDEFLHSYRLARKHGFDNINIDLIFALPLQTMKEWQHTLRDTISLEPEHISAYNLVMEETTPFYDWWKSGELALPSDDIEADMFQYTIETLISHGYMHYEICSYAKPNREVKHNLVYWNNLEYIGLGVGACGYVDSIRYTNIKGIPPYIEAVHQRRKPISDNERLTGSPEKAETLMLALRKRKGICLADYEQRFGEKVDVEFRETIEKWMDLGLLEQSETHLYLTQRGLFLANEVFVELI